MKANISATRNGYFSNYTYNYFCDWFLQLSSRGDLPNNATQIFDILVQYLLVEHMEYALELGLQGGLFWYEIHKKLDTTLCLGSTWCHSIVSEAALYGTSSRDISLYYCPFFFVPKLYVLER